MNICIYGASSNLIDKSYITATEQLGEAIGTKGHGIVYGAGANGLMGAAARGVFRTGGKIVGVVPSFFNVDGVLFENCDELIFTETMRERKQIMEQRADAFVAVPGGIGTFDEIFEILALKQLGRHNKPTAFFNANGYFDNILKMFRFAAEENFMTEKAALMAPCFDDAEKLIEYLENYNPDDYDFSVMKKVEMK